MVTTIFAFFHCSKLFWAPDCLGVRQERKSMRKIYPVDVKSLFHEQDSLCDSHFLKLNHGALPTCSYLCSSSFCDLCEWIWTAHCCENWSCTIIQICSRYVNILSAPAVVFVLPATLTAVTRMKISLSQECIKISLCLAFRRFISKEKHRAWD